MPSPVDDESVEYKIYIQAIEALKALKELADRAVTFDAKMKLAIKTANDSVRKQDKVQKM